MTKKNLSPPDGGWGWMVVLGVSLVNLSTRPIEPSFGLLFGDLLSDLSIETTGAGVIVSSYEAIVNFSGLFVGPLIKSYSFRKVAFLGGILAGLGLIATSPAASMAHILSTYSIINGLGIGFSSSATFVALNHYFKKRRGHAVGITMTGTGLGLLLMPQAVRYLTEEYAFAGSVLILGAFALNACVGAMLLQPVKWHWRKQQLEEGSILNDCEPEKIGSHPRITITTETIDEEEAEDDAVAQEIRHNNRNKWLSKSRQNSVHSDMEHKMRTHDGMNKSSTETKLDKYFEDSKSKSRRKFSEITYKVPFPTGENMLSNSSINRMLETGQTISTIAAARKRKSSTISNLSNLDFHGSGLQIHAIKHEVKEDEEKSVKAEKPASLWSRFSTFMDLDLLKDAKFLNILFGLSIFYVAELNFKMVVPFFLADLGHSKSETAFCLSMMAASDIVARVVLPPICDRITHIISRRTMFLVATIFCAVSRSALAEVGEWIQLETILIVSGFFRGATLINFMLVISEYCDERLDKLPAAFGLHMVAKGLFIAVFGPLIGLIRDASHSYPLCIHAQSAFIMFCSLAWCAEHIILFITNKKVTRDRDNLS